jgi:hypothetical protein
MMTNHYEKNTDVGLKAVKESNAEWRLRKR